MKTPKPKYKRGDVLYLIGYGVTKKVKIFRVEFRQPFLWNGKIIRPGYNYQLYKFDENGNTSTYITVPEKSLRKTKKRK